MEWPALKKDRDRQWITPKRGRPTEGTATDAPISNECDKQYKSAMILLFTMAIGAILIAGCVVYKMIGG